MLYTYFYTICLVFRYTSWYFYVFSGTNLLTSRHSDSSRFSAIFVFQKSYTGKYTNGGRGQKDRGEEEEEADAGGRGGHCRGWLLACFFFL
jgi:hypothetical protein